MKHRQQSGVSEASLFSENIKKRSNGKLQSTIQYELVREDLEAFMMCSLHVMDEVLSRTVRLIKYLTNYLD